MKEYFKILELAAEGKLPKQIDDKSEISVDSVRELIEAGYLNAIDATSFDGPAYLRIRITLQGREYLHSQTSLENKQGTGMINNKIRLFISHSSKDTDFVNLLVELLRAALPLSAAQIRCTSIDGYRLPGGANTDIQLRQEVHDSDAFIGVISFHSIKSLYVVFELGARWGAGRSLIPLIAPGTVANILGGPLAGINALHSGNRSQIHQLISDLSTELNVKPETPGVYERYIESIINFKTQKIESKSIRIENEAFVINPVEVEIGYDKIQATQKFHQYGLSLSVLLKDTPDQDFFKVSLLWPKDIKTVSLQGFEEGEEQKIDNVLYREIAFHVGKRLWPGQKMKVIGNNALVQLRYVFDDEVYNKVYRGSTSDSYNLYYTVFLQSWQPVKGLVSFKELNSF